METEEFISGFCRTCNGSQTVCCEYEEKDGKRILTFMDCAYKRCVNQETEDRDGTLNVR